MSVTLGVSVDVITTGVEAKEGLKARRLDTDVEAGVDGLAGTETLGWAGVAAGLLVTAGPVETRCAACIRT